MTFGRVTLALMGAAVIALGAALVIPAMTRSHVALPPIGPNELVTSIRQAKPGPLAGTVQLDERFGIAGLSGVPRSLSSPRTARLWSDGNGRHRISMPEQGGERTIVNDGHTVWLWDSATRSVTRTPARPPSSAHPFSRHGLGELGQLGRLSASELIGNPAEAASAVLTMLEPSSMVRMDPDAMVANRPTYQLVLDPLPTERTLLREVRVAVDGQTHLPLEVTVLANGSSEPALRIGFRNLSFGPQNPALFSFTPAAGVTVRNRASHSTAPAGQPDKSARAAQPKRSVIGQGWDTVLVRRVNPPPAGRSPLTRSPLNRQSTPIKGSWGRGHLVRTPVGNAVLTSDGRLAIGAVPAQVLTQALSQ